MPRLGGGRLLQAPTMGASHSSKGSFSCTQQLGQFGENKHFLSLLGWLLDSGPSSSDFLGLGGGGRGSCRGSEGVPRAGSSPPLQRRSWSNEERGRRGQWQLHAPQSLLHCRATVPLSPTSLLQSALRTGSPGSGQQCAGSSHVAGTEHPLGRTPGCRWTSGTSTSQTSQGVPTFHFRKLQLPDSCLFSVPGARGRPLWSSIARPRDADAHTPETQGVPDT